MDATTKGIAETLRRWYEAPAAKVIDLEAERRKRWLTKHCRPMPTRPQPPRAA